MTITNINTGDRLINSQTGTIEHVKVKQNEIETIYLALDKNLTGQTKINESDAFAKNHRWVPISEEEVSKYASKCKVASPTIQRTK